MARFRARDVLRARFTRNKLSSSDERLRAMTTEHSHEGHIDARTFLAVLAEHIDRLSDADRKLVTRELDASEEPLSTRERVRLMRLRRELARSVLSTLQKRRAP